MNVDEQIEYWRTGSAEDLAAAESLIEKGHLRHGLFFAHLALEKMLKSHVVRNTRETPPRIHNLVRLARLAGLMPGEGQEKLLRRFDLYHLEGRYPDCPQAEIGADLARQELQEAAEVLRWLKA